MQRQRHGGPGSSGGLRCSLVVSSQVALDSLAALPLPLEITRLWRVAADSTLSLSPYLPSPSLVSCSDPFSATYSLE